MLKKPIKNLEKLTISKSDLPMLRPIIDESNNTLCIMYNDEEIPLELPVRDDYKIDDILNEINDAYVSEDIPIKLKLDKNGKTVIENTKGEIFELNMNINPIGPYLGFQEEQYTGNSRYVSEMAHMFLNDSYFMFIQEISPTMAVVEITPDGVVKQLISNISKSKDPKVRSTLNKTLKNLTIQFRYENDGSSNLINFYDEPHEFTLTCNTKDNTKTNKSVNTPMTRK